VRQVGLLLKLLRVSSPPRRIFCLCGTVLDFIILYPLGTQQQQQLETSP